MGVIYYFSGTGNGYTLAKELAAALQADLKSMAQYLRQPEEITADFIGLVAPVYCMNVPPVVEHFLATVRIKDNPYLFYVADMGATAGGSLGRAKEILAGRGLKLAAGFTVPHAGQQYRVPQSRCYSKPRCWSGCRNGSVPSCTMCRPGGKMPAFGNPTVWNLVNKAGWAFMDDIIDVKNRKLDAQKVYWLRHLRRRLSRGLYYHAGGKARVRTRAATAVLPALTGVLRRLSAWAF
jgi:hypothetical protein